MSIARFVAACIGVVCSTGCLDSSATLQDAVPSAGSPAITAIDSKPVMQQPPAQAAAPAQGNATRSPVAAPAAGLPASPLPATPAPPVTMGGDGAGAMGAMDAPAKAEPTGPVDGTVTVRLTTADIGGSYDPANCGAVWIETAEGDFVKTTERWCGIRAASLARWTRASGGWASPMPRIPIPMPPIPIPIPIPLPGRPAQSSPDQMDAISAATLRAHMPHESTWKMRNVDKELVPDGEYKVVVEVSDGMTQTQEFPFTKGAEPIELMPADSDMLSAVTIEIAPNAP